MRVKEWRWLFWWVAVVVLAFGAAQTGVPWLVGIACAVLAPTIICALLFVYGWLLAKLTKRFGGDPSEGWFAIVTFLSFNLLLAIAIAAIHHGP